MNSCTLQLQEDVNSILVFTSGKDLPRTKISNTGSIHWPTYYPIKAIIRIHVFKIIDCLFIKPINKRIRKRRFLHKLSLFKYKSMYRYKS